MYAIFKEITSEFKVKPEFKKLIAVTNDEQEAKEYCYNNYILNNEICTYQKVKNLVSLKKPNPSDYNFDKKYIAQYFSVNNENKDITLDYFAIDNMLREYLTDGKEYYVKLISPPYWQYIAFSVDVMVNDPYEVLVERVNIKAADMIKKYYQSEDLNIINTHNKIIIFKDQ